MTISPILKNEAKNVLVGALLLVGMYFMVTIPWLKLAMAFVVVGVLVLGVCWLAGKLFMVILKKDTF